MNEWNANDLSFASGSHSYVLKSDMDNKTKEMSKVLRDERKDEDEEWLEHCAV